MSDYLVHHGILGQKWGIRRYQNPDGTLTEQGKKRYSKEEYKKDKKDLWNAAVNVRHTNAFKEAMDQIADNASKNDSMADPIKTINIWNLGISSQEELNKAVKDYEKISKSFIEKYGKEEINKLKGPLQKIGENAIGESERILGEINPRDTLFVSGSSKTQDKKSGYYRRDLSKDVKNELKESIKNNEKIVVGDAPGIDRQVQDYLKKKHYNNVEIYGPGYEVRYSANKKWKTNPIDSSEYEEYSPEWLAKKDKAMTNVSTKGLTITLDEDSKATRNNIERMNSQNKIVKNYELSKNGKRKDSWR